MREGRRLSCLVFGFVFAAAVLLMGCPKDGPRVPAELGAGATRDATNEEGHGNADAASPNKAVEDARTTVNTADIGEDALRWGVYLDSPRLPIVFGAVLASDWASVLPAADSSGVGSATAAQERNVESASGHHDPGTHVPARPLPRALLAADAEGDGDLDVFLAVETSDGWSLLTAMRQGPHFASWVSQANVSAPTTGCGNTGPASLFEWAEGVWFAATLKCGESLWSQALRLRLDGGQAFGQAGMDRGFTDRWTWETRAAGAPLRLCLRDTGSDAADLALCPGDDHAPALALSTSNLAAPRESTFAAQSPAAAPVSGTDADEPSSVTRARLLRAACHVDDRWVITDAQGQPALCPSRDVLAEALRAGVEAALNAGVISAALDLGETLEGLALPAASTAAPFKALEAAAQREALQQLAIVPLEPFAAPAGLRRSRLRFASETLLTVTGTASSADATYYVDVRDGPVTAAADRSLRYRQPLLDRVLMRVTAECGAPHFEWTPSDTLLGEAFTAESGRVTALPSPWHSDCRPAPGVSEFAHVLEWEHGTLWLLAGGQILGYDISSERDAWTDGDAVHVRAAKTRQSWLRRAPYGLVRYSINADGILQRRLLPLPNTASTSRAPSASEGTSDYPDVALSPSGNRWAFIAGNELHIYAGVPVP